MKIGNIRNIRNIRNIGKVISEFFCGTQDERNIVRMRSLMTTAERRRFDADSQYINERINAINYMKSNRDIKDYSVRGYNNLQSDCVRSKLNGTKLNILYNPSITEKEHDLYNSKSFNFIKSMNAKYNSVKD